MTRTCFDQEIDLRSRLDAEGFARLGGYTHFEAHSARNEKVDLWPVVKDIVNGTFQHVPRAGLADWLSRNNDIVGANTNGDT